MTNCRCTIKCPTLAQFPAKGITPDDLKTMKQSDILNQQNINEKFNARAEELLSFIPIKISKITYAENNKKWIVSRFDNFSQHKAKLELFFNQTGISYSFDGTNFVVKSFQDVQHISNIISQRNITFCDDGCFVISCESEFADFEKLIRDENLEIQPDRSEIGTKKSLPDGTMEEDIDVVFEPLSIGEKKKLKEIVRINKFKIVV